MNERKRKRTNKRKKERAEPTSERTNTSFLFRPRPLHVSIETHMNIRDSNQIQSQYIARLILKVQRGELKTWYWIGYGNSTTPARKKGTVQYPYSLFLTVPCCFEHLPVEFVQPFLIPQLRDGGMNSKVAPSKKGAIVQFLAPDGAR